MKWFREVAPIRQKLTVAFSVYTGLLAILTGFAWSSFSLANHKAAPALTASVETLFFACLGLTALSVVAGLLMRKAIADPYVATVLNMEALAAGDIDRPIERADYKDCVGRLARAMSKFREDAVARREAERKAADAQTQKAMVLKLGTGLQMLSEGNLTFRIEQTFPEEFEQLRQNFNAAMDEMQELLGSVSHTAGGIRTGSAEISQASDDLSRRTEQQAASLEETAASVDQVTEAVRQIAKSAVHVNETVGNAHTNATKGGRIVEEAVGAMADIERSAQEIAQIINVIDGIAFQTNLLALNAGVEAARAGDAGKGFAVVANEVRALAQRSADAAKDIKGLIERSTKQVGNGVQLVGESGQALGRIVEQVAEVSVLITQITASTEAQANNLQQVNSAVGQMDKMTQQNASMVEESTAAARGLANEADHLTELVSRFTLADGAKSGGRTNQPAARARKSAPQRSAVPAVHGNLALVSEAFDQDWAEF
jgi:methyl-accepting chemotaxis protein